MDVRGPEVSSLRFLSWKVWGKGRKRSDLRLRNVCLVLLGTG